MKFTFKIQQYQTDAVDAVVNVFEGQPFKDGFSYVQDLGSRNELSFTAEGFANEPIAAGVDLLRNIRKIQHDSNIAESDELVHKLGRVQLDVEMETGTGKTYVYIKTMFELNKRYGWSKFIIVVPSIAIREGVYKSFETMQDHFMQQYGKKARFFIYSSKNLQLLDSFSSDSGLQVMIINSQAFARDMKEGAKNKTSLIIYTERDDFQSRKPIDVIAQNNPIIILDEPQKMGGDATQKGISRFNPLFTINYSATHKEKHNLVYVLDALDAYNKKLVKRIQVKGIEVKNLRGVNGYVYLDGIILSTGKPRASIEFERKTAGGEVKRVRQIFDVGDNLYPASGNMEQYKEGFVISDISAIAPTDAAGKVVFTSGLELHKCEVANDLSEKEIRRIQIRETIRSHLEKEKDLFHKGIKTLSLFFIDEVKKYKDYDQPDQKGEYQRIFEEEYNAVIHDPEYSDLFDPEYMAYLERWPASSVHNGYFSIDKKSHHMIDPATGRGSDTADGEDAVDAYELILKDKERLLSFGESTRFIFSHSALREGWDNPNVFQICTLRHTKSNVTKRQEVGRGMRLCVDQNGDRQDEETLGDEVQNINTLTVIANDSYEEFVKGLQSEISEVLYNRPEKASFQYFRGKTVVSDDGKKQVVTDDMADQIMFWLAMNQYIDQDGKIKDDYREDLKNGSIKPLPPALEPYSKSVNNLVQAIFDEKAFKNMITNANTPTVKENRLNDNFQNKEFQKLWKEINRKYAYTVKFDSNELVRKATERINQELSIPKLIYRTVTGTMNDNVTRDKLRQGDAFGKTRESTEQQTAAPVSSEVKYDVVGKVAEKTKLTRRTVVRILSGMLEAKVEMFRYNPERWLKDVSKYINNEKGTMVVESITYNQTDDTFDNSIFTADRSTREAIRTYKAKKNVQDYVYTDGMSEDSVEKKFAQRLDASDIVDVYAKLPKGFYIPTPVGNYSPDWAIVFHDGSVKHIYFIAETKGSMDSMELREIEKIKIKCAEKCFNENSNSQVRYHQVDSFDTLMDVMNSIK